MMTPIPVTHFQRKRRPTGNYSIESVFSTVRDELKSSVDFTVRVASELSNGVLPRVRIAREAASDRDRIVHVTGDIQFAASLLRRDSSILTCHDCGFLKRFHGMRRSLLKLFWITLPMRRVTCITTVSKATKDDLIAIDPRWESKIVVVHNSVSPKFQYSHKSFDADQLRYLVVGTAPNKNIARILDAIRGLPGELRIIGNVDENVQKTCEEYGIRMSNAHHLNDLEMIDEYRACDIVLFPSTIEGFGIPILEAQATGRPVVTSSLSSMPEVAGDGASFVDPGDVDSIRAGILRVIKDESFRTRIVSAGLSNVQRFSPAAMARGYLDVYSRVNERRMRNLRA